MLSDSIASPKFNPAAGGSNLRQWQLQHRNAIKCPEELLRLLELDSSLLPAAKAASERFPLRVPMPFLRRIVPGDINDPLLKQVLPLAEELNETVGFSSDPVADSAALVAPGILQKYQGRALLTLSPSCSINCRYCFRREFPYSDNQPAGKHLQGTLKWLASHNDISEVILSGGDPLVLPDSLLSNFVEQLEEIPHIRRIRIHSRQPIVLPARIDMKLLDWLGDTHLQTVMVVHCNHPNEIDDDVAIAMDDLRGTGTTLLNQAVLLKGVNDDQQVLNDLSEQLFAAGVLPYYLNILDQVRGSAHFAVEMKKAKALMQGMRESLPGYLVPRLVQDQPGKLSKVVIA